MYSPPPTPREENARQHVLDALRLVDTQPEPDFDNLVELGRAFFAADYVLVSLVDNNRQWFKAKSGLEANETPRDVSFCGHAILGEGPFVITDAKADIRFAENPLVLGAPHVRFYAGVPLIVKNMAIGTFCIIDTDQRNDFNAQDLLNLQRFGHLAEELIDARSLRHSVRA